MKGFALMLLIGTVVSLITAVAATRAMLGLLAGFSWFDNPRFMGAAGAAGARSSCRSTSWAAAASGSSISRRRRSCISVVSLAVRGLNLGIDFKGGVQITFTTPKPTLALDRCATRRPRSAASDAVVQGRGTSTNGGETTRASRSG